ncbi:hypothetical protein [Cellulophaga sp. Hel_I_12]|uniref:hypothetical protein n=1 Tax=Cellulophaga sp. Hel_I_12 TaxID=1249972 RepID=UPI0006454DA7|nr:hypothetical protein [Cellulophaga sp. Hel_I_12]
MALENTKKDLIEAEAAIRSYLAQSEEYIKLRVFKILTRFFTAGLQSILMGLALVISLLFLSFGISLALGEALDSYSLGFIVVGGFYGMVTILIYIVKKRINKPVIKKLSALYFDEL